MSDKPKIALFVGADVVAHLIINQVVPYLVKYGYEPVLFFPDHIAGAKANLPELQHMAFFERKILAETIYPYLENNQGLARQPNLTPRQLAKKHNLQMERVKDVNDPEFVNKIAGMDLFGAFSIRCYQIFKREIINVVHETGFFANMHPGILPEYRGVYSTARAMADNYPLIGCTLHEIDTGIDTGPIYWPSVKDRVQGKTVFATQMDLVPLGTDSIESVFWELGNGRSIKGTKAQVPDKAHYYTYPTQAELNDWAAKGLRLYDRNEVADTLTAAFNSYPNSRAGRDLHDTIVQAIDTHFGQSTPANDRGVPGNGVREQFSASTISNDNRTPFKSAIQGMIQPMRTFRRRNVPLHT